MLEISRKDVISTDIMQFDAANRFIKLPIEEYLDLLGTKPNSAQIALINALNNPKYRFVCAAISRRQGKTYITNVIGQLVSLIPNSHILIMSPNYALSQISFDLQRQLIRHFDLEVVRDNAKDKVIELSNGSTIRMGSVNQVDSTVGRSYEIPEVRDSENRELRSRIRKSKSLTEISALVASLITLSIIKVTLRPEGLLDESEPEETEDAAVQHDGDEAIMIDASTINIVANKEIGDAE